MAKAKKNKLSDLNGDIEQIAKMILSKNSKPPKEIKEELKDIMKPMLNPNSKKISKNNQFISEELVWQAFEETPSKGKKLIKKALALDPNNAEAYNYLATLEKNAEDAVKLFSKAIEAARTTLGVKYFEENKGYFWGLLETRPFMRAMAGKAECLWLDGHTAEAISIYEELLALNPGDNQGIRYILSTVLLGEEDLSKYEKFVTTQDPENCAVWNYNNALFAFKKYGLTKKSVDLLQIAEKQNPHVFEYFLGFKLIPDVLPQYIGRGDENEAISYVAEATNNWMNTPGALGLLFEYKLKGGELF